MINNRQFTKASTHHADTTTLSAAEQLALDIIKNERAVVKVVNPESVFTLNQIADPCKNRPSRSLNFYQGKFSMERPASVVKFNPKTFAVHQHEFGKCHERKHGLDFTHTKKTAVSFIPTDPRYMRLFTSPGHTGLLWDIDSCDLKEERYLFGDDVTNPWSDTDWCDWLDVKLERDTNPDRSEYEKNRIFIDDAIEREHSTSVERYRETNRQAVLQKNRLTFNEWLVCLPKGKVNAVFHLVDAILGENLEEYRDTPSARLKAWDYMLEVKLKLGLNENIPVLIISDVTPVRVYTEKNHQEDLKAELSSHHQLAARLAEGTHTRPSFFKDARIPELGVINEALKSLKSAALPTETTGDIMSAFMQFIATSKNPLRLLREVVPLMRGYGLKRMHILHNSYLQDPAKFMQYCSEIKNYLKNQERDVISDSASFELAMQNALSTPFTNKLQ